MARSSAFWRPSFVRISGGTASAASTKRWSEERHPPFDRGPHRRAVEQGQQVLGQIAV